MVLVVKNNALPAQLEHHLDQIDDEQLRAAITHEFTQLNKRFGLVFERHMPEGVRLPGHPIRRGSKVAITHRAGKPVKDPKFYTVRTIDRDNSTALLTPTNGEPFTHPLDEIMVAKEFGDITYPGLKVLNQLRTDDRPDAPTHAIINGENHHVLEALQYTHAGKVDLIYIDPPYNTGNADWKYNDRYVDTTDGYRHSKWLSFMERRLLLAKKLLKDTGVIFVAIGDDEHHRLRSLMDQIFGEQNFISNIVWQGSRKNDARYVSNGADYMLTYSKDVQLMSSEDVKWRESKQGVKEIHEAAATAWKDSGHDSNLATKLLRNWWSKLPKEHPAKIGGRSTTNFRWIDGVARPGEVFAESALAWPGESGGHRYEVIHPITKRAVTKPKSGWRHTEDSLKHLIDQNLVLFGEDETRLPYRKRFLTDSTTQGPESVFIASRRTSGERLQKVLGNKRFPYPKDHEVLMRWFRMVAPKDAVVLDFFGGSGTTAEAVMRLNAEDGGTRQAILVTNNELSKADDTKLRKAGHKPGDTEYEALGVFHHVTKQRLEIVATGNREDGSTYENTAPGNLTFMEFKYLEEVDILQGKSISDLTGLFWLKAGGTGTAPVITAEDLRRGFTVSDHMAILLKTSAARELKSYVSTNDIELNALFIVTDSDAQGDEAAKLFAGTPAIERIYGPYLEAFQVNKNG